MDFIITWHKCVWHDDNVSCARIRPTVQKVEVILKNHNHYTPETKFHPVVGWSRGPCIFLVRSITWRLMDGIQYNFRQWSSTLRGSAVHKTITPSWLITELLPFVTFSCPEHNLKTTGWNSIQLHTVVKHIKKKCSAQEP
jgi:hypothetical protein